MVSSAMTSGPTALNKFRIINIDFVTRKILVRTSTKYLTSNTEASDQFGRSISLSVDGNTLAVGAYFENGAALGLDGNQTDDCDALPADQVNCADRSGAVYVYSRDALGWGSTPPVYIKASNTEFGDLFGRSVSLSADGNTLAVGAMYEDSAALGIDGDQTDNAAGDSGAVYLY